MDVGTLTMERSTVSGNTDNGQGIGGGGGIKCRACVVTDSTISGNSTTFSAGGISVRFLALTNSSVSGNTTNGGGGDGIAISGPNGSGTLTNSTVTDNSGSSNALGVGG